MKGKQRKKFMSLFSVFIVLLAILSGCNIVFRENGTHLTNEEKFYLQNQDGTTSLTEVSKDSVIPVNVDSSITVGGYIESPLNSQFVYWVPRYTESNDGYTYYDMQTDIGRPTKVPASASINNVLVNPMDPNQVLVSINVLDQNHTNVDGYTHVFVNETNGKNNIQFYDFDFVSDFPFGIGVDPATSAGPGWKTGDATSTIFGNYHLNTSFFDKFSSANGNGETPLINTLLDSENPNGLEKNTASPKDGVVAVFTTINEDVWNEGSLSLDLKTGENSFATLKVDLPQLTSATTGNGTVQLSWPKVFGTANGYHIFQDGQQIAEVNSETTTYEVNNLTVGNTYNFTVKGIVQSNGAWVDSDLALSVSQSVTDVTPPVITIKGDNPINIDVQTPFTDPGVTAVDQVEGDLTENVTVSGQVDVNTPGEYQLVYSVSDQAGNVGTITRTVKVVDKKAPVLTLKGESILSIEQGSTFTDPGVTAVDQVDGDLTATVMITGQVDVNTPGEYQLVYHVSDRASNKSEVTRIVKVKAKDVVTATQNHNDNGEVKVVQKENSLLPDTSTNQYNWIMAGTLVLLIGVLMYLIALKRKVY